MRQDGTSGRPSGASWSEVVRAVAERQDRAAFAALFEHFAPRIKSFMRRSGSSAAEADELVQETFLAVWRKAGLFDPATNGVSAWIFTIARNLRTDARRKAGRSGVVDGIEVDEEFQVDEGPGPDQRLALKQEQSLVRAALTQLSPEQLSVVELSFFEEKAHAEIASTLGIPLGTVKSRLRLAMGRLRALLSDAS